MSAAPVLFGLLNLNKGSGCSSRDLVNRVQKLVRPQKTGHAGTLDPLATGVLVVGIGDATRLVSRVQEFSKTYTAEFILGQCSDTDDSTGCIHLHPVPVVPPRIEMVREALNQLTGVIAQTPPSFSAVHVSGRRAYDLARRGEVPELQPREVTVHAIRLLDYQWPLLKLEIECSSGTYIRAIARDLGRILECGGLMSRLERTAIGPFHISESLDPDELSRDVIERSLISPLEIVRGMPHYQCTADDLYTLRCGRRLFIQASRLSESGLLPTGTSVALVTDAPSFLCAIAEVKEDQLLQPRLVFLH
ncbi:MAG: tRNA pseudouridine synthase [Planctomycetota bacterium]|jgi:tRNA pseudouridine55 synthase